jgi:Rieske Fe-S protein
MDPKQCLTRRQLVGAGLAASGATLAMPTLAACSGSSSGTTPAAAPSPDAAGGPLTQVADIPVGGAVSAVGPDGKPIVIAQPEAGTVVAFSAVCTHQGCTVVPNGSTLDCPCHGSVFEAATGRNVSGPAPSPLPAVAVRVEGGAVVAG